MDGLYSNNNSYSSNNGGYCSQGPRSGNCGSCGNCPGGHCPRMEAGGSGCGARGMSQPGCPGGNCCPGGRCTAGKSRYNPDWQYGAR
ncbi:keratin-associated protein 17-1 [Drosophila mauritiana]|uniref:Keratin-associated protein 17-1 n=1 Tax=Drosophila mauritiana TaxID=7226 RepID=A0A6P8JVL7_DROMA|nr:keratin-associated protein 17-1 [Drosophila mauritiana]